MGWICKLSICKMRPGVVKWKFVKYGICTKWSGPCSISSTILLNFFFTIHQRMLHLKITVNLYNSREKGVFAFMAKIKANADSLHTLKIINSPYQPTIFPQITCTSYMPITPNFYCNIGKNTRPNVYSTFYRLSPYFTYLEVLQYAVNHTYKYIHTTFI